MPEEKVFDQGDSARLEVEFRDPITKVLVNPTTVVCRVYKPSGAIATPGVTNPSTGVWLALQSVDEPGPARWRYEFTASGTYVGREEGTFQVRQRMVPAP